MPALANHCSVLLGTGSVNVFLKRIKAAQSISVPFDTIPFPCIRLFQSTISVAPTSTFFGSQPRNGQLPPKGLESIIATSQPADRHLEAARRGCCACSNDYKIKLFCHGDSPLELYFLQN